MANFRPFKKYIFYCLDRLIDQYGISPPFLDVGCGVGDISQHVASKEWYGKAIDVSDIAVEKAKHNLDSFTSIEIEKKSLFEETKSYKTIFLIDVLEHLKNDIAALQKISSLLFPNGHVIIAVPSNPKEWRWDDDYYGHYRRYTVEEMRTKLLNVGLEPLVFWDFTYPFFWIMRRIYTRLRFFKKDIKEDKSEATIVSSTVNAWDISFFSKFLSRKFAFWNLVYKIQFIYFRNKTKKGCEMIILAKKIV